MARVNPKNLGPEQVVIPQGDPSRGRQEWQCTTDTNLTELETGMVGANYMRDTRDNLINLTAL
jgi:hypothetical protein